MLTAPTRLELHVGHDEPGGIWSCAIINDGRHELVRRGSAEQIAELVAEQLEQLVASAIEQHQRCSASPYHNFPT
jgi:hypothetical protein